MSEDRKLLIEESTIRQALKETLEETFYFQTGQTGNTNTNGLVYAVKITMSRDILRDI